MSESPANQTLPITAHNAQIVRNGQRLVYVDQFAIKGSKFISIVGPNGAGKSLHLALLTGRIKPDKGSVLWAGTAPDRFRQHCIGMLLQTPILFRRSVRDNLELALKPLGVDRQERAQKTGSTLEEAGLSHLARRSARTLSGGERQRLALARVMITQPQLLCLDEPTNGLDPASVQAIECQLKQVHERGIPILMITHDLAQARRLSDEIIFIADGQITERSPTEQFFNKPTSQAAETFLAGDIL